VRVHSDAETARALKARAYTIGNDIVFGAGQYAPATNEGRLLLAHELTHVVQQSGGLHGRNTPKEILPAPSPRISKWHIDVPGGVATSDRHSDTLWGLARLLTGQGVLWTYIMPISMQSPRAGSAEFWRYIWIGDTFNISSLVMQVGSLPWNPNTMVTFLASSGDQNVIQSLLNAGFSIIRFSTAFFTWRDNASGAETEEEATGLMGETCATGQVMGCARGSEILIRSGQNTNEAASTLLHERGHVVSNEPDYLEQEIQIRIAEEEFRIRHNMPPGGPGYRNPDGTVNEAAIRQSVIGSNVYNPSTRRMIGLRYQGRRRTSGWAQLLGRICP